MDPVSNIESETHQRVLELLARGQADQDALEARLSPEERAARGELHDWSPKDHVAHNNFWRQDAIWRLRASVATPQTYLEKRGLNTGSGK